MPETSPTPRLPGEIRSDSAYSVVEFRARTGLKEWAFRATKKRGLSVRRCGRNGYVLGSDWLEFLRRRGEK